MQIAAHFQQIFFGLNYRTLESTLKQMPDYLMPAIKVDRVLTPAEDKRQFDAS
jgi:hypothetical protein